MMEFVKEIATSFFGITISLGIAFVVLLLPLIVLTNLYSRRSKKKLLNSRWEKFVQKFGDRDIKAYVNTVAKTLESIDTSYPLMNEYGQLLKQQPLASQLTLSGLERYLAAELGETVPIRSDDFKQNMRLALLRRWQKVKDQIGDEDIKTFVKRVATERGLDFDLRYPLTDEDGGILDDQPSQSITVLFALERYLEKEQA